MTITFRPVTFTISFLIIASIVFVVDRKKKNKYTFFFRSLLIVYILLMVAITILPITIFSKEELDRIHSNFGDYITYYQFVPFETIMNVGNYNFAKQVLGNILLFMPFPIFIKIMRKSMSGKRIVLIGIMTSIGIEMLQLINDIITRYPTHVCDIDDLILNGFGVILGYTLYNAIIRVSYLNNFVEYMVYNEPHKQYKKRG